MIIIMSTIFSLTVNVAPAVVPKTEIRLVNESGEVVEYNGLQAEGLVQIQRGNGEWGTMCNR